MDGAGNSGVVSRTLGIAIGYFFLWERNKRVVVEMQRVVGTRFGGTMIWSILFPKLRDTAL